MEFPVFNFADILICTGVGLFVLNTIVTEFFSKNKKGEKYYEINQKNALPCALSCYGFLVNDCSQC